MESKWGLIPDMSLAVTLRELISIDLAKELTNDRASLQWHQSKGCGAGYPNQR
jgi:uncharacterized protein (DUF779 family)